MRRIIMLVAVAAMLAASLGASPSPAAADDWNDANCIGVDFDRGCVGISDRDCGWDCADWNHFNRNDCDRWDCGDRHHFDRDDCGWGHCGDWNRFDWDNDCDRWDCADFEVDDCWFLWWDQFGDPVFVCEVDID
jgi:hypothetical protein